MLRNLPFLALLLSCPLSTTSFAMEDDFNFYHNKLPNICIEKSQELKQFFSEYKEKGKPISLAVACGSWEMPEKIQNAFQSNVPAIENWIALDLYLTDKDKFRGGPHIRMDVNNTLHWQEVATYLKENGVEVQTVALTILTPSISSPILHDIILPLVKKGGMVVYPQYFSSDVKSKFYVSGTSFYCEAYGQEFENGLKSYRNPSSSYYLNKETLMETTIRWIGKLPGTIHHSTLGDSEKKFEAKVYINRVASFKEEYFNNGQILTHKIKALGTPTGHSKHIFTKTEAEFTKDYLGYFKEYMAEAYPSINYKIYCSSQETKGELYGVEDYDYPKNGTFKLTGYAGDPSLVVIKK